ncbi:MAG: response regulator [Phycisphaera sp.]|nr:MAG: response regulator [Phycisphaera sp.]
MKIMLVDDSKTMRNIQKSVLTQLGYSDIEEASDGEEALGLLETSAPDLLLVDCDMPHMDGLGFVKAFRRSDSTTPIIMVTTEAEKAHVAEAIKAGVDNYVVKPFTPDLLSQRIQETLAKCEAA